ncbi:MAG: dihydropteroate synthase [Solirubrobacteraceae bacterium]|nr:dihydropteroate synthase [Solirubrobacteraceae bacterium]
MRLRLRDTTLAIEPGRPLLMGIVNANPDSFSDAVRMGTLAEQVQHALALVSDGADMIDVGGESGVTYTAVSPAEVEAGRVVPLVKALVAEGVTVSVDTWKAAVAERVLEAGAHVINDTSGLADPRLAELCAGAGAALVVMHTRAAPKHEGFPDYGGDVRGDVLELLPERCALAVAHGLSDEQLIVDPGPDFAKRPGESIAVMGDLRSLHALGRPVLAAVSRKYFIGAITGRPPQERLAGTLAALGEAIDAGAAIARVHDVRDAADFLAVRGVLRGERELPAFDASDERLKWIQAEE